MQAPTGVEQLVRLLLHDTSFARAVQQKDGEAAAASAVGVIKSHFKSFANVLRPGSTVASLMAHGDPGSPTAGRRLSSAAGGEGGAGGISRRTSDAGGLQKPSELRVKDRVVINVAPKKCDVDLVGQEGVVVGLTANGWVKVQVCGEVLDLPTRHVSLLPKQALGGTITSSSFGAGGAAGANRGLALKGSGRSFARRADAIKLMRKELMAMEEEVPWKEVADRWRQVRRKWCSSVRQAESPQQLAALVLELHEHLKTNKSSGLFAAGGPWEAQLMACVRGEGGHNQLMALWEDMKGALQSWLAAGSVPGGMSSLDRSTYDQALATYAVLQEAAVKGPDYLEQVPLDQLLTTQKEVLALQHIIQREAAAAHSRLQALATGATAAAAGLQQQQQQQQLLPPLLPPGAEGGGGLHGALLMQLGKLPRLRAGPGAAGAEGGDDDDTDRDAGSDATDVGDLDTVMAEGDQEEQQQQLEGTAA